MDLTQTPAAHLQDLERAQAFIATTYRSTVGSELVSIENAQGLILAEDMTSPCALPRFPAAAMDGFAVRDADFPGGLSTMLRIAGTAKAGHPYCMPLEPGQSVRIYTGAMVPDGADRVIMQEDCKAGNGTVTAETGPLRKKHIRYPGEDVQEGQPLLRAGTRLTLGHLALLNSVQTRTVRVRKALKVALLSTGDELRQPQEELAEGQIVDTNGPYLKSMLHRLGCVVDDRGIVPDDAETLLSTLVSAAADNDLIITSGGASVGVEDHLKQLIRKRGNLEFWRLRMKPGKPVGLGDVDDCPLLLLPGNPVAAAVAFRLLGYTLITALSGETQRRQIAIRLPLLAAPKKTTDKLEVLAARLAIGPGGASVVEILPTQGSASLFALAMAEGWAVIPADLPNARPPDVVDFYPV